MNEANLVSLIAILSINLLVLVSIGKRTSITRNERRTLEIGHIFWTANWFLWLLSWFIFLKTNSPQASVILNDLGAFCLIAFAIAFSSGMTAVKKYAIPLCSFFILDCMYLLTMDVLIHGPSQDETTIPTGLPPDKLSEWISEIIHHHTILFGPSLCITMLAIGLVAWAVANRTKQFEYGIVVGFVGVVYALSQIYIYQSGLFVPFLTLGVGAKFFLIGWRILFVSAYWLVTLAAAGITVPGVRVWGAVTAGLGLVSTIVALISNLRGKH